MKNTEILIIGGGVIGACSTLYLTRQGKRVTLVEKKDLCAGASHGNACWIAVAHAIPTAAPGAMGQGLKWMLDSGSPFYIKPRLNLDLARWLWYFRSAATHDKMMAGAAIILDLSRKSLDLYKKLDAEGLDFDFSQQGLVHVHLSETYRKAGKATLELLSVFDVEGHLLDRDSLQALEPRLRDGIESGVYYPEPAQIRSDKFVKAVARQAEAEGATILTGTAVTGFAKSNGRISAIQTSKGDFTADEVVLAAGAWSSLVAKQLGERLVMEPAKGYSVTARRPSANHGPSRPIAVDDYKLAITPLGDDFRFSSTLELAGFDLSINKKRLAANREGLHRVLPGLEHVDVKETWSGYRPLSADGLPIIGRSKRIGNLIYATGHGMMGMTHGPITGKVVSQMVTGQEPDVNLEPLRPDRF
jgi:D-amino-acid dehydrogenase